MIRAELIGYLQTRHAQMATLVGYDDWDTPVDQALAALGVLYADRLTVVLNDDSQRPDAQLLADFYTLDALLLPISTFADIFAGDPKVSKQRSQIYRNTKQTRDELKGRLEARGYAVDSLFSTGRINLDFLEPMPQM